MKKYLEVISPAQCPFLKAGTCYHVSNVKISKLKEKPPFISGYPLCEWDWDKDGYDSFPANCPLLELKE